MRVSYLNCKQCFLFFTTINHRTRNEKREDQMAARLKTALLHRWFAVSFVAVWNCAFRPHSEHSEAFFIDWLAVEVPAQLKNFSIPSTGKTYWPTLNWSDLLSIRYISLIICRYMLFGNGRTSSLLFRVYYCVRALFRKSALNFRTPCQIGFVFMKCIVMLFAFWRKYKKLLSCISTCKY